MTGSSAWRALWRLAWRDIRRRPGHSLLVVALIALPVAAIVAGTVMVETNRGTPEDQATAVMGQADALVEDPTDPPLTTSQVRSLLPPGTEVAPITTGTGTLINAGARVPVGVVSADVTGILAGTFAIIEGRRPGSAREVSLTTPVLERGDVEVGDTVDIDALGRVTVVGEVLDTDRQLAPVVVAAPGALRPGRQWVVALPSGTNLDLEALEERVNVITRGEAAIPSSTEANILLVLGGFGMVEAGMVVTAAFAVSIRRRQRELGLLAAGGGSPQQLRTVVRLSGIALGVLGSIGGAILGLGGALVLLPYLRDRSERVIEGLVISPGRIVVAVILGVITAVVAAALPARGAVRLPVVTALAGRRPPTAPSRHWALVGIALVGGGLAMVIGAVLPSVGATIREVLGPNGTPITILLGSVLSVLGFGAASPWLLDLLSRIGTRLPLGLRLAVRDTGRFRTRNGPVVTAVIAGLAGSVALGTVLHSFDIRDRANHHPVLATDQIAVIGPQAHQVAKDLGAELDAVAVTELQLPRSDDGSGVDSFLEVPSDQSPAETGERQQLRSAIGDETTVRALGGDDDAVAAFKRGEAILWWPDPSIERLRVADPDKSAPERSIPVHVVSRGQRPTLLPDAVVSPDTIRRLGIADDLVAPDRVVVRLDDPVSDSQYEIARELAAMTTNTFVERERGYTSSTGALQTGAMVTALLTSLIVVTVALALAAAEAHDDQRTLAAVGAAPGIQRNLAAGRAAVLSIIGGLLAVPAGLLPAWGVLTNIPSTEPTVAWRPVMIAALLVPLVTIGGAWLLTRPAAPWSRHPRIP